MKNITIAMPFHNEEENLKILLPEIVKIINRIKKNKIQIFLVDDCSKDNSYNFCKKFIKKQKKTKIKLLKLKKRGKQTGAIKRAIEYIKSDYIITMDSDLQDPPKYLPLFIKKINKNYDLVVGCRAVRKKIPYILKVAIKVYDFILEIILKKKLETYRTPFAAYKSKYIKNLPWYKNDHRYLVPISIFRGAKKCTIVRYTPQDRKFGKTHYNAVLKIFPGFFEVMIFILKVKLGYYDKRI